MDDLSRYIWEVKIKEVGSNWSTIELNEMRKNLLHSYIEVGPILSAMIDGLVVQTPFAEYRAVPKNRFHRP